MGKIAIAQITIADLSDPIISGSAPSNPVNDMLWLDTSVSPNVLKRYSNGAWIVVNDTSNLVERIATAEQKITDDAIVATVTESKKYIGLVERVSSAENKLTAEAMETTIGNSGALSNVKQTADKINWLVASGDSASNMQMTSEAYTLISENITLTADKINAVADDINLAGNNTVKITSADQITAEAAKNIDLSANESAKVTAAKINAVADDIDLSGNDSVHISSADQIDISAVNDLNLSSNGTISLIAGRVDDLEDDAIYDSATPPATATAGKKWLDRGVEPAQLRRWKGLTTTPNGGTMTTAREIEESASGRVISLDNSGNQIDGTLSVVVQGFNLLPLNKTTYSVTASGVTMTYNGNGGFTFSGTATADQVFAITDKEWIRYYKFYYPMTQLVASVTCSNYPSTGTVTFSARNADDWTVLADFSATNGQYQAFAGNGKEALVFFYVANGTVFTDSYVAYPQIQTGSTPTAFSAYKNTVSVIRCGKNMCDIFALCNGFSGAQGGTVGKYPENGGFDITATANDAYTNPWNGANYDIPVRPNTTYTLSWDIYMVPATGTSMVMYFIDHRFESGYYGQAAYDTHKLTFTTPSDAKSVSFRFGVQKNGESVGYANLQLELGSARTTFETYSGVTTEVPLAIDAYHGWNVEIESQSGLNNILTNADAMSIEYDCSGWETIGDTSELQRTVDQNTLDAARIEAIANEADQLSKENAANFKRVVEIQEGADGGLVVGDNLSNCSIKIKSASIELRVNNTAVATYAQDYVRLQDMQIRVPSGVGGLVLSKFG